MDFSKFDFVITGDPSKHRLLDLFEVNDRACLPQRQHGSCRFVSLDCCCCAFAFCCYCTDVIL